MTFGESIGVNEVFTGVVGRVDVDAFDALAVGAVEQLEDFEVLALDDDVAARLVRVDGACWIVNERGAAGCEGLALRGGLAIPAEVVAFGLGNQLGVHHLLEFVDVKAALV